MKAKLTNRTVASLKPKKKPYDARDTEIKGFLIRIRPTGNMTYLLQYRNDAGRQQHYRIGTVGNLTPVQARDIAERKAAEVANGTDIQSERKQKRIEGEKTRYQTLSGLIEHKYEPWVTEHRKYGQEAVRRIERNFSQFYDRPLTDVNSWVVEKWRTDRLKAGLSRKTINKDITILKAALSKAVEWELIDVNPLAKVKPLKLDDAESVRYLSVAEEKRLRRLMIDRDNRIKTGRDSANDWRKERGYTPLPSLAKSIYADHLSPMVLLAMNTGIRRGELFDMTWDNINFNTKTLTIIGSKTKSGKTRHIPLNNEAIKVLKAWQKQTGSTGLVFPNKNGNRFDSIQTAWEGLIKDAKIKDFRFHDLRHDFASKLVMKGAPLNTIRELLGHADLKTTLRYAHLAPDHKADAVALLNS